MEAPRTWTPIDAARYLCDDELVVLAADHDRIVAEAEARGWNAAVEAVQARVMNLPVVGPLAGTDSTLAAAHVLQAIAALRKPEVEG